MKCAAAAAVAASGAALQLQAESTMRSVDALSCAVSLACLLAYLYEHQLRDLLRLLGGPEVLAAAALVSQGGGRH